MTWLLSLGAGGATLLGFAGFLGLYTALARIGGLIREEPDLRSMMGVLARIVVLSTGIQIFGIEIAKDVDSIWQVKFWVLLVVSLVFGMILNGIQQWRLTKSGPNTWGKQALVGVFVSLAMLLAASIVVGQFLPGWVWLIGCVIGILGGPVSIIEIIGRSLRSRAEEAQNPAQRRAWVQEILAGSVAGGILSACVVEGLIIFALFCVFLENDRGAGFLAVMLFGHIIGGILVLMLSILSGMMYTLVILSDAATRGLADIIFLLLSHILVPLRFTTQVCGHCLRYTFPFPSSYAAGVRFCEHCGHEVPRFKTVGSIVLTFGRIDLTPDDRVFWLADPDFEHTTEPVDVAAVYIDPDTCDRHLFERFVTYILNHPPCFGLQSVRIFSTDSLTRLGTNMNNVLRNNFAGTITRL